MYGFYFYRPWTNRESGVGLLGSENYRGRERYRFGFGLARVASVQQVGEFRRGNICATVGYFSVY